MKSQESFSSSEEQVTRPENREKLEKRLENASRIFSDFVKIKPGERALFLIDANEFNTDRDLIDVLQRELTRRGIEYDEIVADENLNQEGLVQAAQHANVVWDSWDMEGATVDFYEFAKFIAEQNKRMAWSPGVRVESLDSDGALAEPKEEMERRLEVMDSKLHEAAGLRIQTSYGTELAMSLKKGARRWFKSTGELREGEWDNFPGGEIFTTPDEESVEGILVLPALQDEITKDQGVDEFVRLTIRNGKIATIDGGISAEKLRKYLEEKGKEEQRDPTSVLQCAEIAFGANAKARTVVSNPEGSYTDITNPTSETEKRLGTMHIAFGSSKHGEEGTEGNTETESGMHVDFVIPRHGLTVTLFKTKTDFVKRRNGEYFIHEGRLSFLG